MNIDNIADFNNEGDFLHTILLEQIFGKILELENLINVKKDNWVNEVDHDGTGSEK